MMEAVSSVPVDRTGTPNVRLILSNRAENVALVRQMLAGVAEAVGLDEHDLNDISTAATEACNNVVLHAYEGAEGPLQIDVFAGPEAIEVVVRDQGTGTPPRVRIPDEAAGIGLAVIQALAQRVEFRRSPDSGTEVRMEFATPRARTLPPCSEDELQLPPIAEAELATTIEITIAPAPLARTILPRMLSMFAARAHFSTDRIADLQLVADALVAHFPGSISGSHLSVAIHVQPRDIELRIAPLRAGRAGQLILDSALAGLDPVIDTLTDHHRVATIDAPADTEMLALRLIDPR
jgi:serine/threonine-protein kinase RsbW